MKRRRPFWMSIGLMVSLAFNTGAVLAQSVEPPAKGQSVTIDRIRASGTLRAGAATALPWLGQNPASHEFFGPSVEMGKELADRLGVKLELIPSGYDTIIAGLQANQFDITIAALSATEKRKQVVDFVNYTIAGTCYAVLADNAKVNTLEDLNQPSVSIGTWTGTGTEQVVKEKYTKATINSVVMPVPGSNRMQDVITKRIDAATLDSPRALLVVHQFPQLKIIPGGPDECIAHPDLPVPIGIAIAKGDPVFAAWLQAAIAQMQRKIDAAITKYSSLEYMLAK
jgi:polar amino acid transport system substrate-binding protein